MDINKIPEDELDKLIFGLLVSLPNLPPDLSVEISAECFKLDLGVDYEPSKDEVINWMNNFGELLNNNFEDNSMFENVIRPGVKNALEKLLSNGSIKVLAIPVEDVNELIKSAEIDRLKMSN